MIYEQESIKLLSHLGLLGQRPETFIRLTSHILAELSRKNGYGSVPLPFNNEFGVDGNRINPSNYLNALEQLPPNLQLLTVIRSNGKLHWFHDDETLTVDDHSFDFEEELDKRKSESKGFRKAHSVSLNTDRIFEFMAVTGLNANNLKLSTDTEFLRSYYSSMRIHRSDSKSFVRITEDTPSHLIKLLPHTHDFIRRDVICNDDSGNPIGPYPVRIYGAPWHNLPKADRKNWTLLNWRNKGVYHASELMDLDINSCALAVVSHYFGYDSHEMVSRLSHHAFENGLVPLEGFNRKQVKFMVNSIIHGGFQRPATSALNETAQAMPETYESNQEVVELLSDYLPPLRDVIRYHKNNMIERVSESGRKYKVVSTDARKHFMFMYQGVESDWAMKMLRFAYDNKLSVLTFHDGFTVPRVQLPIFQSYSNLVLPNYLSTSVDPFIENDNREPIEIN